MWLRQIEEGKEHEYEGLEQEISTLVYKEHAQYWDTNSIEEG
jgi:hypothetical protein